MMGKPYSLLGDYRVATNWKKNLPNILTMFRIILVIPIVYCLYLNTITMGYWAAVFFVMASVTDYLDGTLARKFNVSSPFGIFMDPIADKILVTSTLVMLIPIGKLDAIMVILLLARDSFINGLRSLAAKENRIIAAGPLGKWKTAIQMIGIPAVLVHETFGGFSSVIFGYWILWISVALSLASGVQYSWNYFRPEPKAK